MSDLITLSQVESIDDFVTDNYRARIAAGEIINNPCVYTSVSTTEESASGIVSYNPPYTGTSVTVWQNGPMTAYTMAASGANYLAAPSTQTVFEERAMQRALANIDNTPFAFGEDTLELKETLEFLKNPVKGILDLTLGSRRKIAKAKRKRYRITNHNWNKEVSKFVLEYRFAASPLYRSAMDAIDAYVVKSAPVKPPRLTARGFDVDTAEVSDSILTATSHNFDRRSQRESSVKASILYEVSNPIYDWKYRLGFRPKDWPTTFWQVVPLSFMVDRMFDITSFSKGVINMLDPNVKILAASVTNRDKIVQECTYTGYTATAQWSSTGSGNTRKYESFTYDRKVWNPSIRDTFPSLDLEGLVDSATKVSELAALVVSARWW
jgi:hypothetical protein